jgi:hypothetical protein
LDGLRCSLDGLGAALVHAGDEIQKRADFGEAVASKLDRIADGVHRIADALEKQNESDPIQAILAAEKARGEATGAQAPQEVPEWMLR